MGLNIQSGRQTGWRAKVFAALSLAAFAGFANAAENSVPASGSESGIAATITAFDGAQAIDYRITYNQRDLNVVFGTNVSIPLMAQAVTGAIPSAVWTVIDGGLPQGLFLNKTGPLTAELSGQIRFVGQWCTIISAKAPNSEQTAEEKICLIAQDATLPKLLSSQKLPDAMEGKPYMTQIQFSEPVQLEWVEDEGLNLDTDSGMEFTLTADELASAVLTPVLKVTSKMGVEFYIQLTLDVNDDTITCAPGYDYDADRGACYPQNRAITCGAGEYYDPDTGGCEAYLPPPPSIVCYSGQYYDDFLGRCVWPSAPRCPYGYSYNSTWNRCEQDWWYRPSCGWGAHWSYYYNTCVSDWAYGCPDGSFYSRSSGRCVDVDRWRDDRDHERDEHRNRRHNCKPGEVFRDGSCHSPSTGGGRPGNGGGRPGNGGSNNGGGRPGHGGGDHHCKPGDIFRDGSCHSPGGSRPGNGGGGRPGNGGGRPGNGGSNNGGGRPGHGGGLPGNGGGDHHCKPGDVFRDGACHSRGNGGAGHGGGRPGNGGVGHPGNGGSNNGGGRPGNGGSNNGGGRPGNGGSSGGGDHHCKPGEVFRDGACHSVGGRPGNGGSRPGNGGSNNGGGSHPGNGGSNNGGGSRPGNGGSNNGGGSRPGNGGSNNGAGSRPGNGGSNNGGGSRPGNGGSNNGGGRPGNGGSNNGGGRPGNGGSHGGGSNNGGNHGGSSGGGDRGGNRGGSSGGGSGGGHGGGDRDDHRGGGRGHR